MVFQDLAPFLNLTVYKNIAFGLEVRGLPEAEIKRRVKEVMELVRLPFHEFAHRRIHQLSGGQQQRVAIARALATDPQVLLLDEPFSHLDYKVKIELIAELRALQRELGITTVYVTHDQNDAMVLSDRLAVMKDGRVLQVGTPMSVYLRPKHPFVASFFGDANVLRLTASGGVARLDGAEIPVGEDGEVVVIVRPEHIYIGPAPSKEGYVEVRGKVVDRAFMGPFAKLVVEASGYKLTVYSRPHIMKRTSLGQEVTLHWSRRRMIVFKERA